MKVQIKSSENTIEIETNENNPLVAFAKNSIFINAYCGGKGVCKKCIVKYITNPPQPTDKETEIFTKEEITDGYRLICLHKLKDNDYIEVFEAKPSFSKIINNICVDDDKNYIAIDIGTTTIAISLISNGKHKDTLNILNPQVSFGGDVITRIAYSNEFSKETLVSVLNSSITKAIKTLKLKHNINSIKEIVASANPTMIAFFLNQDPKSIGEYPYTPPFVGSLKTKWNDIDTYIPPIIGAFVGSDITAGLINMDIKKNFLFIDIGTNCEFILKYKDKIFAASVPGGPALEGGGIDYGTIAKDGAIESLEFDSTLKIKTINDKKPIGIAGSGLISAIALLRQFEIIDKSGRLLESWEIEDAPLQLINRIKKNGFLLDNNIFLTQNSIREFQLVKASLNAGLQLLLNKTDININKIDTIYLAGGFTKSLTKKELINSGLLTLDKEFIFLGNSSLNGSTQLFCKKNREFLENISKRINYIEIANENNFQELYLSNMDFK